MGDSLNPTVVDRLSRALRPDFARTVLARRTAAAFLVLLAAAAALRPDPAGAYTDVVVTVRDLSPGRTLTDDDVHMEKRAIPTLPDGARTELDPVLGATLAGPARRGEVLTDARVLGSRLAGLAVGPDARVVPLHLADAAVPDLIRTGAVVDVLGAADAAAQAHPRVQVRLAADVDGRATGPEIGQAAGEGRILLRRRQCLPRRRRRACLGGRTGGPQYDEQGQERSSHRGPWT